MRKTLNRPRNFVTIDKIKFDSKEEASFYELLRDGKAYEKTGIDELRGIKLITARPEPIELYPTLKLGKYTIRKRVYTPDFIIKKKDGTVVHLEYKSAFTEKKADYRLRKAIFLFLHGTKYSFAEIIKIRNGIYDYKEYF